MQGELTAKRIGSRAMPRWALPAGVGLLAAAALSGFYLGLLGSLQGAGHAWESLRRDAPFIVPLALGFGVQWGLFAQLWRVRRAGMRSSAAALSPGAGASGVSMVACCLHHAADALPALGLSGASAFLAQYRAPFLGLALAMNLGGVAWMWLALRRVERRRCHLTA